MEKLQRQYKILRVEVGVENRLHPEESTNNS